MRFARGGERRHGALGDTGVTAATEGSAQTVLIGRSFTRYPVRRCSNLLVLLREIAALVVLQKIVEAFQPGPREEA